MAEDYIDLVGQEGIARLDEAKKKVQDLGKIVVDVNGKIKSVYDSLNKNKTAKDLNDSIKHAEELIKKLTDATKKYEQAKKAAMDADMKSAKVKKEEAKANKDNADAELKSAKAAEYARRTKKSLEDQSKKNEAAAEKETRKLEQLADEYGILSKAYTEAARRAKNYQISLGENHPIAVQATADARALGDQLKKLDASVGQHTRNVGNYASANLELQYILRDLPSFANGVQVGIMGISNNISPLADKIDMLRKAGMSNAQIFMDMARSFMSFSGVLSLVVAGITILSSSWERLLITSDSASKAQQKAVEGYVEEEVRLKSLREEVLNTTTSQDRLRQIRDKLVAQYPALAENLSGEENLQYKLANSITAVTGALRERALIRAAEDVIVEETKKMLKGEIDTWDMIVTSFKSGIVGMPKAIADQAKKSASEYEDMYARMTKIIEQARARLKASGFETFFDTTGGGKAAAKEVEETIEQLNIVLKAVQDADPSIITSAVETLTSRQKEIVSLQLEEAQRLRMLEEGYARGLTSFEDYQKGKEKIAKEISAKIIEYQIEEIKALILTGDLTKQQITELEQKMAGLISMLAKLREGVKPEGDESSGEMWWAKYVETVKSAADQVARITDAMTKRKIDNLKREEDAAGRRYDNEVKKIEVSEMRGKDKEAALQQAYIDSEAERKRIDDERVKAQKRQVAFEKSLAVTKAFISMFTAIAKEIETKGVAGLATSGAITAYLSGIIGVIGSIAIPEYAEGTDNHPGGLAKVGDGGEHELLKFPGGKMQWSPNTDTIMNLPKGTEVIPMSHLVQMASGNPEALTRVIPMQYGDNQAIANAVASGVKSVIKDLPQTTLNLTDKGLQTTVKKGSVKITYYGANNK